MVFFPYSYPPSFLQLLILFFAGTIWKEDMHSAFWHCLTQRRWTQKWWCSYFGDAHHHPAAVPRVCVLISC